MSSIPWRLLGRFNSSSHLVLIILISRCVFLAVTDDLSSDDQRNYERGLFPPTFNLASGADITANATCGESGPETFCKLVEHVRAPQCGVCDAKSANESQRHPITNAIDGTIRWWQSPSLQNGRQFESVSITLDLKQAYQVAYVIVKAANSPRPGNWILERSLDGIHFKPWQYFAMNDGECLETYGIVPTIGIPRFRSDDEVICTSRYSRLEPLENGEIHMSLVKGRPGVAGPSDKLQEFVAARYVRLRLQKIRTLQGDLMILATYDWERVHTTVTRRGLYLPLQLFYSIKDISIGGQCMCFGHAKDCLDDPHTGRLKCRCVHNTCGDSCEKCCPLYNQKQWRVGTSHEAGICEKCQCNGHADECYYDKGVASGRESLNIEGKFDGGGVCVNCSDFTGGFNCERCLDGYYRPLGVALDASHPCQKCVCDGAGATGQCVADASLLNRGLSPGDCICRDGFGGPQCAQCAIGYRNYPVCDLCPCNAAGTVNTECEGDCVCKLNVDGVRCDRCKPGHFNLDKNNPWGCTKCYCFNVSHKCTSANLGVHLLSSLEGWLVSDLLGNRVIRPFTEQGILTVANDEMTGYDAYYWLSPTNFTGDKLPSYGGRLHFHAGFVHARGDSAGWPTKGPVLILDGGGLLIAYAEDMPRMSNGVVANVALTEHGWYHLSADATGQFTRGSVVSRGDFMQVLFSLDRILIQAKFHTDQIVGKFITVSMEIGSETMLSVKRMKGVEKCSCPIGYSGFSCEHCSWGYRRVNETVHGGECRQCDCHGHVATCDSYTGQCLECLHNTTGLHCEQCRDGFYGVATRGSPTDCRPCTCPLKDPRNNFSPTCVTKEDRLSGDVDYVCTACPMGYEGDKCERCADGYFGNPLIPGDYCQRCECHGHLDINSVGGCDRRTGQCLKCSGNTVGWHCEQCIDGFFGNPLEGDCQPCNCNPFGSEPATTCNKSTGECVCRRRFEGHSCDRCIEHFGNVEAHCEPCDCHVLGSETNLCSPLSGQCTCKPGVFGFKCDTCRDGYFNFSIAGCEWCNCHMDGSLNGSCHSHNGQCYCQPHVVGQRCDICQDGHWGLDSPMGCRSCSCNTTGSRSRGCDMQTGQCDCEVGVTGLRCERCHVGYYGFSERGCRLCEPCTTAGHICHPTTGDCVCPPFTEGPVCERCQANTWGFNSLQGCKPCNCNLDGSLDLQCDVTTGKCVCREGYEGDQCSRCHFGYFAFPRCKPCRCDIDGTDTNKCRDGGLCECQENGQCPCKVNKEGKRCKQCKMGTFKLLSSHPKGCLECFCFGKSSRCSQAKYTWTRLAHPDIGQTSAEEQQRSTLSIVNGLKIIPGASGNDNFDFPSFLTEPLYWSLPHAVKGDMVLSYTGHLYFHVQSDGGEPFPNAVLDTYPLVQVQGNFRLVLEYFPEILPLDGHYKVPLHEDHWKIRNNHETPVTRELMMVVLQNVQHVFVRATKSADFSSIRLDGVAIDVAVPAPPLSPVVAAGIELCHCPPQYNGTSCQNPADGYYRKRKKDFLNSKDILDLVGWAEPCRCNNRSETCDKETGVCQNCRNNTAGPNCDVCAMGFYGDVFKAPCSPCACPYINNSFSEFCQLDVFGVLQCLNCKEGYMGSRCERCADGYYGDPQLPGGRCKPCSCDPRGSMGPVCDQLTGQCICLEGLSGRDCSTCFARHILTQHGCYSCDDGCTGLLLTDLENLMQQMVSVNLTGVISAPWEDLFAFVDRTNAFRKHIESWTSAVDGGEQLLVDFDATFNLQGISSNLLVKSWELRSNATSTAEKGLQTKEKAALVNQFVVQLAMKMDVTVKRLLDYTRGVKNASISLDAAFAEAQQKLDDIRKRDFASKAKSDVEVELRKSQMLLNSTKKLTNDSQNKENLTKRLNHLNDVFDDVSRFTQETKAKVQETLLLNRTNWRRLQELESELNRLENMSDVFIASRDGWGELLNDANEEFSDANANFIDLEGELDALIQNCYDVGRFVNTYAILLPDYEARYLRSVQRHARKLMDQALLLNQSFNSIRNESGHALRAIMVYEEMLNSLNGAHQSAKEARDSAVVARGEALPERAKSLETKASQSKAASEKLIENAQSTRDGILEDIRGKFNSQQNIVKIIESTMSKADTDLKMLNNGIEVLGRGIKTDVDLVMANTSKSLKTAGEVAKKVDNIKRNITKDVIPRLKALQVASPEGMGTLNKNVNNVLNVIGNLTSSISRLEKNRSDVYREFNASLDRVKGLVLAARQRVSSLTLSLSGNGGKCVRSLRPDVRPSATSTISFKYAVNTDAPDGFLFYLGSEKYHDKALDFMAIEMFDRRVRFVWNAGEDTVVIEHTLRLQTNEETYKYNERWYQIVAQRIGNLGMLSVRRSNESLLGADPNRVTGNSAPGHSRMDLDHESHFIFGRLPSNITKSTELKSKLKAVTGFHGCVYDLQLDLHPVSMWNFIENEGCMPCKQGPSDYEDVSTNEAFFNGEGYAISRLKGRYPSKDDHYSFAFMFKTLDEAALLLFAPNNETGFFLMVALEGGHVVFTIGADRKSYRLRSSQKHNTDTWTQVEIRKLKSDAQLRIGSEPTRSLVDVNVNLRQRHDFYLGGLPPTVDTNRWASWKNLSLIPLLGCLRGVQEDRTPITIVDERIFGVERGCRDRTVNRLSVPGKGYLELKGQPLKNNSSFGFTFQSFMPNGLLLLSTFAGEPAKQLADFYSVALKESRLHLFVGTEGTGKKELVHGEPLDLGGSHHVFIIRNGTRVEMFVNDKKVGNLSLENHLEISSPMNGGLFIGGISSNVRSVAKEQAATTLSFLGLIRDTVFDYNLMSFNNPVAFEHVGIGRSREMESIVDELVGTTISPTMASCKDMQVTVDESAVQFGDSPNSYVEKRFSNGKQAEMQISFEFRTRYPNGLLLMLFSAKSNRNYNYLAIYLNNSDLVLQFNGFHQGSRTPSRSRTAHGTFTELTWQQVVLKKRRKKLVLTLPNQARPKSRLTMSVPKNFELGSSYSVGGISPNFNVGKLEVSALKEPFHGCIRNFSINAASVDLTGGNVRQCFSTVSDGSYFGGDAYAVYKEMFEVGAKIDIQLEFRTTQTKGTLLSVSEQNDSPSLALELHQGRVVMSVNGGGGRILKAIAPMKNTSFNTCDDSWHVIKASYSSGSISLRVDKTAIVYDHLSVMEALKTSSPLYIGGLPDSAPKGSLTYKENLIGCIRNLLINDKRPDWIDWPYLHNVLLNSCPTS